MPGDWSGSYEKISILWPDGRILNHVNILQSAVILFFGFIIGSFLTVCVYRLPFGRQKGPPAMGPDDGEVEESESEADLVKPLVEEGRSLSITYPPRSFCPRCSEQLKWYHNIPLFSWIFLGGRCAFCKATIPVRYPLVELLTGFAALLTADMYFVGAEDPGTAIIIFLFCCSLIVISFIDIEYYIIPNKITYPGVIIAAVIAAVNQQFSLFGPPVVQGLEESFWGLMAGAGLLFFVAKTYELIRRRQGLGLGDVKLLAFIGMLFGPAASLFTIFLGSMVGGVIGGGQLLLSRQGLSRPLPFGPYLAIGTALFIFVGLDNLLDFLAYLQQ